VRAAQARGAGIGVDEIKQHAPALAAPVPASRARHGGRGAAGSHPWPLIASAGAGIIRPSIVARASKEKRRDAPMASRIGRHLFNPCIS
jgi:hypothetical protein